MTCRSCGATIADKAIVCYRCGTPTIDPGALGAARSVRPRRAKWLAVPVLLGLIALAVWLVPKTPAGSTTRWIAWTIFVGTAAGVVALFRRR